MLQIEKHTEYYISKVEKIDCNVAIDGRNFFDQPVKNDIKTYENIREIATGSGHNYTTDSQLNYPSFKENYKMIITDFSKEQVLDADPKAIRQIDFTGNLDIAGNTTIFFILEEAKATNLSFS